MRRDTQIGVILGVVILGIIAVFLSTRTHIYESKKEEHGRREEDVGKAVPEKEKQQVAPQAETFIDNTIVEGTLETDTEKIYDTSEVEKKEDILSEVKEAETAETAEISETKISSLTEELNVVDKAEKLAPDSRQGIEEIGVQKPGAASEVAEVKEIKESAVATITGYEKGVKDLIHKVEHGDNLFTLAKRYYDDPKQWMKIYNANVDVIYDRNSLPVGKELIIPEARVIDTIYSKDTTSLEEITSIPQSKRRVDEKRHIVRQGDTLYKLSRQYYGNTENWILIYNANKGRLGDNNTLYVGQELTIPDTKALAQGPKRNDLKPLRSEKIINNDKEQDYKTYEVKKGDTLYKIARQFYNDGSKWRKIYEANKEILPNSSDLEAGKVIVIPK